VRLFTLYLRGVNIEKYTSPSSRGWGRYLPMLFGRKLKRRPRKRKEIWKEERWNIQGILMLKGQNKCKRIKNKGKKNGVSVSRGGIKILFSGGGGIWLYLLMCSVSRLTGDSGALLHVLGL
jgi:hypothetical protein